jgi:hypothetical protein
MSLPCSIESCQRTSTVLCYECNKSFCAEHLKEHDQYLNSQLQPLANEIKNLSNRYALINQNKLINHFREQLDKWRQNSHKTIDRLYKEKCDELKRDWPQKLAKPQKDLERLRAKNMEFIREERTTHQDIEQLREEIRVLDQQIKDIEQKGIQIDIRPLSIEKKIDIEPPEHEISDTEQEQEHEVEEIQFIDLSIPYRAIDCSGQSGVAFTGNNTNLLIYEYRTLSLLDQDLISMEQSSWNNGHIIDMCWSTTLNHFIVVTDKKTVYQINENPFKFKRIESIPQEQWWSCTCSEQFLFLTAQGKETFIFQFNLKSSFETIKYWRSPATCKQHQFIHDIKYYNQSLALIIIDSIDKTAHFELRSSTNLNKFFSFQIDINETSYQPAIHSCLIKYNQWIIIVENTSQIYHIDKNGTLLSIYQYKPPVWNAVLFASNILAIRTENKIIFHKI